jgi:hypothetical protein
MNPLKGKGKGLRIFSLFITGDFHTVLMPLGFGNERKPNLNLKIVAF